MNHIAGKQELALLGAGFDGSRKALKTGKNVSKPQPHGKEVATHGYCRVI